MRRGRRRRPRRWNVRIRRNWDERSQLFLALILGLGLSLALIRGFDAAIRPHLVALAETKLQTQLVSLSEDAFQQVMTQEALSGGDLLRSQLNGDGQLEALSLDTVQLNGLRSRIVSAVAQAVGELDSRDLGVPLGALTGLDLLSAMGPKLPVRVVSVASARGEYRNEFLEAGINQTLYRVMLDVEVTARLLLPGGVVETRLATPVVIAETLIVGQVPQIYVGLNK